MNNKTTKSVGETQYVKDTSDFAEVPDHPVKMHVEGNLQFCGYSLKSY